MSSVPRKFASLRPRRRPTAVVQVTVGALLIVAAGLQLAGLRTVIRSGAFHLLDPSVAWIVAVLEGVLGMSLVVGRIRGWAPRLLWAELVMTAVALILQHNTVFEHGVPFQLSAAGQPLIRHAVLIAGALPVVALAAAPRRTARPADRTRPMSSSPRVLP